VHLSLVLLAAPAAALLLHTAEFGAAASRSRAVIFASARRLSMSTPFTPRETGAPLVTMPRRAT
jgi:hypothetical protein